MSVGVLWKRWSGAVASNASNFVGVAGMQLRCNCWLPESSSSSSSTIYKERNACLTRIQISQQLSRSEENLMSQSLCHLAVNIPGAHCNPCEVESKGSRLDIPTLLQRFRPACAAALGLASYRARVKLWFLLDWALNFARVARVHMFWSSWLPELRVCD